MSCELCTKTYHYLQLHPLSTICYTPHALEPIQTDKKHIGLRHIEDALAERNIKILDVVNVANIIAEYGLSYSTKEENGDIHTYDFRQNMRYDYEGKIKKQTIFDEDGFVVACKSWINDEPFYDIIVKPKTCKILDRDFEQLEECKVWRKNSQGEVLLMREIGFIGVPGLPTEEVSKLYIETQTMISFLHNGTRHASTFDLNGEMVSSTHKNERVEWVKGWFMYLYDRLKAICGLC